MKRQAKMKDNHGRPKVGFTERNDQEESCYRKGISIHQRETEVEGVSSASQRNCDSPTSYTLAVARKLLRHDDRLDVVNKHPLLRPSLCPNSCE